MIAERVVVGRRIHAGAAAGPGVVGPGFVALIGDRIVAVDAAGGSPDDLIGPGTEVFDAGEGSVVAGLHDNHTFFTSQLLDHGGTDAGRLTDDDAVSAVRAAGGAPVVLRGMDASRASRLVSRAEAEHPDADVVALADDRAAIVATAAATRRLGELDPESNESLHALYAQLAQDPAAVRAAFSAAAAIMHRGGVTSVKDIAFDTHLGMLSTIDGMLADGDLRMRYAFASQPVAATADLAAGEAWRDRAGARFHGFKLMTDGSFDAGTADLLPPDDRWRRGQTSAVDYPAVQAEAERILAAGFRLALNADGDGAVRACIAVFERYAAAGRALPDGCSLSDVSLIDVGDAFRAARLGLAVETYPQMLRYPGYTHELMEELLGDERGRRLANLPALLAAGVLVSAGTDFPLFEPSLPESLLSSSERLLGTASLRERWLPDRSVDRRAVIGMWTDAGAAAMGEADRWGVLAPGAAADIAVFDTDLLSAPVEELAAARTTLVLAGGAVVHSA